MPVSRELAFEWECGDFTDPAFRPPDETTKSFIEARTRPWEDRLRSYWAWYHEKDCLADPSPQDKLFMKHHLGQTLSIEPQDGDGFLVRRLKRWIGNHRLESERKRRIGTEFHGFTSLPAEIRTMIYKHLLIAPTGKFLMPPEKDEEIDVSHMRNTNGSIYRRFEDFIVRRKESSFLPQIKRQPLLTLGLLLCVNKAVQSEAEAVFFGGNMMVFTNISPTECAAYWWTDTFDRVRLALRRISVALVIRDSYIHEDFAAMFWGNDVVSLRKHLEDWDELLSDEEKDTVRQAAHNNTDDSEEWGMPGYLVLFPNLEFLEISVEEANCLAGCCRKVDFICRSLVEAYAKTPALCPPNPPKVIKFLGTDSALEREVICEYFEASRAFRETEIIFE